MARWHRLLLGCSGGNCLNGRPFCTEHPDRSVPHVDEVWMKPICPLCFQARPRAGLIQTVRPMRAAREVLPRPTAERSVTHVKTHPMWNLPRELDPRARLREADLPANWWAAGRSSQTGHSPSGRRRPEVTPQRHQISSASLGLSHRAPTSRESAADVNRGRSMLLIADGISGRLCR